MTAGSPTYAYADVDAAIAAVCERLHSLSAEAVALGEAAGRVLAEPVASDRPSPACDMSAMDGYAIRAADAARGVLPVKGEVVTGEAPPDLPETAAIRVFTGGALPRGADAIVPRERVDELGDRIVFSKGLAVAVGQFVRYRGENGGAGVEVVQAGTIVTPATIAAAAMFGRPTLRVARPVRLSIVVTGNEVRRDGGAASPWQVRDSNGPGLAALLSRPRWIAPGGTRHVADERASLCTTVASMLANSDALVITGGVSMGDFDLVPESLLACGVEPVFHRLPIRPGKPVFAGIAPSGQAVVGLPGNPVSALVGGRRIVVPILRKLAGFAGPEADSWVEVVNEDERRLDLQWFRLVRRLTDNRVELVETRSSGDLLAAARADGFVEVARGSAGGGRRRYFSWIIGE